MNLDPNFAFDPSRMAAPAAAMDPSANTTSQGDSFHSLSSYLSASAENSDTSVPNDDSVFYLPSSFYEIPETLPTGNLLDGPFYVLDFVIPTIPDYPYPYYVSDSENHSFHSPVRVVRRTRINTGAASTCSGSSSRSGNLKSPEPSETSETFVSSRKRSSDDFEASLTRPGKRKISHAAEIEVEALFQDLEVAWMLPEMEAMEVNLEIAPAAHMQDMSLLVGPSQGQCRLSANDVAVNSL
ncbi:OLC1v1034440C1 [Oldenlandia corymbosa var. corymbosa]|uniref:OLC1v1034440C1 n=1 Tax=Oldenlandia corymbosa var. corymbosa TaxID=529605 RepID=A0AAV1CRB0_OLDCO|nr:OLC1v1034440C1 [Oldenlandia corymbosa var. corymbosa]